MTTTTNLNITHLEAAQNQKETTVNDALNAIDGALAGLFTYNFTSAVAYTVSTGNDDHLNMCVRITDVSTKLAATTTVIFPNNNQLHVVQNNTLQSIVFKTALGTGVTVGPSTLETIYCDGTDILSVAALSSTAYPHDMNFFIGDNPASGATIALLPTSRIVAFTSAVSNQSIGYCITTATASSEYVLYKDGSRFGAFKFISSQASALVSISDTTFQVGNIFTIIAPNPQDASLQGVGLSIKALRY